MSADAPARVERQYRAALRAYPAGWRRREEVGVLGTLLDLAEAEGRSTADATEVASLVRHGLVARLDRIVRADARATAATIAIATGTGYAVVQAVCIALAAHQPASDPLTRSAEIQQLVVLQSILAAAWLAITCCAAFGSERLRLAWLGGLAAALCGLGVLHSVPGPPHVSAFSLVFQGLLGAVALGGRPRPGRVAPALALAAAGAFAVIAVGSGEPGLFGSIASWGAGPLQASGLTIGLVLGCVMAAGAYNLDSAHIGGALLGAMPPWIVMLVVELRLNPMNRFDWPLPVECAGLVAVALALALWARRRRRTRSRARQQEYFG